MITSYTGKDSGSYKEVFFDLDGTITDSGEGCISSVKYMFSKLGREETDREKLRGFLGPPLAQHLMRTYSLGSAEAEKAYGFYREHYLSEGIYQNRLFEGITEVIEDIRNSGKSVYVATSKPEPQALSVLERFGLLPFMSGVFGARHEDGIAEKNQVLEYAVSTLGGALRAVMVGDRHYDILGGKHVGFDTVGVLYGYGSRDELVGAGCDFTADTTHDLSILLGGGSK